MVLVTTFKAPPTKKAKLSWDYCSSLPSQTRSGNGIEMECMTELPKEDFEKRMWHELYHKTFLLIFSIFISKFTRIRDSNLRLSLFLSIRAYGLDILESISVSLWLLMNIAHVLYSRTLYAPHGVHECSERSVLLLKNSLK